MMGLLATNLSLGTGDCIPDCDHDPRNSNRDIKYNLLAALFNVSLFYQCTENHAVLNICVNVYQAVE